MNRARLHFAGSLLDLGSGYGYPGRFWVRFLLFLDDDDYDQLSLRPIAFEGRKEGRSSVEGRLCAFGEDGGGYCCVLWKSFAGNELTMGSKKSQYKDTNEELLEEKKK